MTLETLQNILKDKKFWLFVIILIFIAVLGIGSFLATRPTKTPLGTGIEPEIRPTRPEVAVLRVEPLPDQGGVTTSPTIKIVFDKSISTKTITVTFSPKIAFSREVSLEGYTITILPKKALKPSTKYTGNINIKETKIYSWSFTTGKKGTDPAVINEIKNKLPFSGEHFIVSYSSTSDKFFVTIDAKPADKYKEAARTWFASQGLTDAEKKINIFYFLVGEAAD